MIKSVVIVGLGALGTYYADAFQKAGSFDVYILVDEERKNRYKAEPRVLNGAPVTFRYVLPEETSIKADLIIICVKSNAMRQAVDMICNYIGENTIILSLMNGVSIEPMLCDRYGAEHVLYAVYRGGGIQNLNGQIRDIQSNCLFIGTVGNPHDEEQVALTAEAFERASIHYNIEEDMLCTYWSKYAIIVGCNQLCALLGTDYTVFHQTAGALGFAEALVKEMVPLAAAAGVKHAEQLPEETVRTALSIPQDCYPSIAQDREMKRRMEVDIFSGEVVKRTKEKGIPAPFNEAVAQLLGMMNQMNGYDL